MVAAVAVTAGVVPEVRPAAHAAAAHAAAAVAAAGRADARDSQGLRAGHGRTAEEPGRRRVADGAPHLRRLGLQPARPDHAGQRRPAAAGVGVLDRRRQRPRGGSCRRQRRDVPVDARAPRRRHRRQDRRAAVALHQGRGRDDHRAASDHARHRALWRQSVLRRQRRDAGRPRCAHRRPGVGDQGGREQGRLLHDAGAAGRRRQGDGRRLGRRARRARLRGRVRRRDRQADLAHLHRAGAGRARQRDLAQGRPVEERRCAGLGHRQLRPGHQPDVLGHRQRRAVDGRPAAGRQPLHRVDRGARRHHRAASRATSNTTPTTRGTGTRCRRRSWSTSSATAAP